MTLLDFSERLELRWLSAVIAPVLSAARDIPVLLAGATARDVLLWYAYGIKIIRASTDIDLAFAVPSWEVFHRLRDALLSQHGFTQGRVPHVIFLGTQRVDLIPFGAVERSDRTIAWPPDAGTVMSTLGFAEALATALLVRFPEGVETRIVSLPALAVLKVAAWSGRHVTSPGKDASDIWLILRNYADAGNADRIYHQHASKFESLRFDIDRTGAWLLGADARAVMERGPEPAQAVASIRAILDSEVDLDGRLQLVTQMPIGDKDRQLLLLEAFHAGFVGPISA